MRECIEEGILQGYFDGELSSEMMESVASHLASCLACTAAAAELESESVLLSEALQPEFALSVPTERLRHRVDVAIAGLRVVNANAGGRLVPSGRGWWQSLVDSLTLSPQRAFGYAGLAAVVLFALVLGLVQLKRTPPRGTTAVGPDQAKVVPVASPGPVNPSGGIAKVNPLPIPESSPSRFVLVASHPKLNRQPSIDKGESAHVKLLPGERSYLKTIAALDTTIKAESNQPMRPALQSEYERNLAMVDRAIAATRSAAKSNPNDPDAAEFMFAAYQTKVDLLNQVADARLSSKRR